MNMTEIIKSKIDGLTMSLKFEFIDPNNTKFGWFTEYHRESATFDEVYDRFLQHPECTGARHKDVFKYLFDSNKENMFAEMFKVIGEDYPDHNTMEEVCAEIERECKISIGSINPKGKPTDADVTEDWCLGVNAGFYCLRSPYMDTVNAIKKVQILTDGLTARSFAAGNGAFKVYIRTALVPFKAMAWFKALMIFDTTSIIAEMNQLTVEQRRAELDRRVTKATVEDAIDFVGRILHKTKKSKVAFDDGVMTVSLADGERVLNEKSNIQAWFNRLVFALAIASNRELYREEFVKRLREMIRFMGIKK